MVKVRDIRSRESPREAPRENAPKQAPQSELRELIALENQLRALQREVNKRKNSLLKRLLAGYKVEPGIHTAEIIRTEKHGGQKQEVDVR